MSERDFEHDTNPALEPVDPVEGVEPISIDGDTSPGGPAEPEPFYRYPGSTAEAAYAAPQRRQGGGLGCWVIGLVSLVVAVTLIGVGLLLPPFSLLDRLQSSDFVMLDAENASIRSADAQVELLPADPADTGTDFGVRLATVPLDSFLSGSSSEDVIWVASANAAVPPYLALQSPVYALETTGTAPGETAFLVNLPGTASPDVLDLYGWYGGEWRFIPAQPNTAGSLTARVRELPQGVALFQAVPRDPVVLTVLDFGHTLSDELANLLTVVAPAGMQPSLPTTPQRTLVGNPAPGFDVTATYQVMPAVRNFSAPLATDPATVTGIINNSDLRGEHIEQLAAFTSAGGYDGLVIDYRDLPESDRAAFSRFIRELSAEMQAFGLTLAVVVPAAEPIDGRWQTGAYDWRVIGEAADYVVIDMPADPTAFAPGADRLVESMLRWAVGEVSRYKLVAGLPALSQREVTGQFSPVGYDAALARLGDVALDVSATDAGTIEPGSEIRIALDGTDALPGVDTTVQTPFIEYLNADGTPASRVWLTTGEALRFRMDRGTPFALAGVALNRLLAEGVAEGVPDAILNYKLQVPGAAAQAQLALNWRIEGADGVLTEFTTGFNEEVVVTLAAPDGNYAVNVDVVGGDSPSARGGAAVALFAPTPTPTPRPTATPEPTATPTPTLAPVVPTAEPPPGTGGGGAPPPAPGPAVAPGAGSIAVGSFEYGGHVTNTGSDRAANAMRSAGMTWMKVQFRYSVGMSGGAAAEVINNARARGFKILLGVVGSPAELAAGGAGYIEQFARFLGEVAGLGPEAIEVWNEPNISREWPEGQISGANYTAMLSAAYQAIKAVNPGVLVIAGAPAPTGAEALFPGRVMNDDRFLAEMMAAGALNVMDCLGLHYNEGLTPPRTTNDDPRDQFYTRHLPTMVNVYRNAVGGQRPICVTELGYMSDEGYGPPPAGFEWAAGRISVAQQAAWLADAAAYLSQQGDVRLMIVWNIDFTYYGTDPMGGYAIIRPDGSCPACSALAGAR